VARFLRTDTNSSGGHSRYRGPVPPILFPPFVARPVQVNQAVDLSRRNFRVVARIAKSSLPQVKVIGAGIVFRPVQVNPAVDALRRNFRVVARIPKSHLFGVVYPPKVYAPIYGLLTPPRDRNPPTKYHLAPPVVVAQAAVFIASPVAVSLAYSLRGTPKSRLQPPAVVTPAAVQFVAAPVRVTLTRIRPFPTDASVFKPAVIAQAQGPQGGVGIQLAPSFRGKPKSRLFAPVVAEAVTFVASPVEVKLARSFRGTAKSRLLTVPAAFRPIGFTVKTELAYSKRGTPKSRLKPPTVIDLTPQVFVVERTLVRITHPPVAHRLFPPTDLIDRQDLGKVEVTLVRIRPQRTIFRVEPPVVIDLTPQVFRGRVELAYSLRGKPKSVLRKPTDLVDAQDLGFVKAHLAYSLRGKPKSRLSPPAVVGPVLARPLDVTLAPQKRGTPKPHLSLTAIIDLTPQTKFLAVTLAPSSHGIPKPHLFPPAVVTAVVAVTFTGPKVVLTRIRPVRTVGVLRPPAVVAPVLARPTDVTFAPQKRGVPKSRLSLTAIVDLRPQTYYVATTLVRIRPVRTIARLFPPTDVSDNADLGFVAVTLAPQKRGTPKPILRKPVVIDLRPQAFVVSVTFAPSFRGKPKPFLGKPTDLVDRQDLGFVAVTLAYSLRGKPKSRLIPPAVVAPVLARPIEVRLAPSSHGVPKSRLEPPTVVFPFIARATDVTLVRIRPVPTLHGLRRPVDLVDRDDVGFVRVHLAYSLRGKPKSVLRPPVVIDLRPQTYYLFTSLAPSRFPKPKSVLRFTKITATPQFDSTVLVHLAYQSRGKPKSKLRAPAVVGAGIYFRPVQVELSYSSRRRGKAVLRKPTVVAPVLAKPVDVTLAYQSRGKPKSKLRPPVVVQAFRIPVVQVRLVRIRPVAVHSRLKPPTDLVDQQDLGFVSVTLAASRFPKPKSVLRKPTVVQAFRIPVVLVHLVRIRPVAVHVLLGKPTDLVDTQDLGFVKVRLAPSRFPKPVSRLSPPTVVFPFTARPTDITLVRIVPPAVHSLVRKPTDLVDAQDLGRVRVTVVRIRPVPVRSLLKPPTEVVQPENIPTATTFVTITPPRVHSRLKPPTVVGASIVFRPVLTHLTYSSRGKTMFLLTPMGEGQVCFGTVTGFDFAPSVCGYDEGAVVTGSDSTSHVVTGSDFGATVTGTSAAGGTVTGGDTKREGC
jgi:hypothetical protein